MENKWELKNIEDLYCDLKQCVQHKSIYTFMYSASSKQKPVNVQFHIFTTNEETTYYTLTIFFAFTKKK